MPLTQEQQVAYDAVVAGESVLITGLAGSGKSTVVQSIVKWFRSQQKSVAVTSMTGSSAVLIEGRTLHSFLGIGLATKSAEALAAEVSRKKKHVLGGIRKMDMLVIDEVSMLDADLFDKVSTFLSILRFDERPFGGVQMIFSGDFAQIKPVQGSFCFNSDTWKDMDVRTFVFTKPIRQENDTAFQTMLGSLRWGNCTKDILYTLKATKDTVFPEGIVPTVMYSKNIDVDTINKERYDALVATGVRTRSYPTKYSKKPKTQSWADACKIPKQTDLCIGAQVMCTYNIDTERGVTNGARATVLSLEPEGPRVRFVSGLEMVVERVKTECEDEGGIHASFVPLKLAWAITVHKSQGMTLDAVVLDLGSSIFESGMAYTALSRVKSLSAVRITNVLARSFRVHPEVVEFYERCASI